MHLTPLSQELIQLNLGVKIIKIKIANNPMASDVMAVKIN
jgi:hypothetical protein